MRSIVSAVVVSTFLVAGAANAEKKVHLMSAEAPQVKATYADIQKTFGFVPTFLKKYPPEGITGAWEVFKAIQLNPKSHVLPKYKELIGLGIASQIPCHYCTYFHTKAAKAAGATDREINEAVAVAANVRLWSTFLHGVQYDIADVRKDTDKLLDHAREVQEMVKEGKQPPAPMPLTDAESAFADMKAQAGFVPGFMRELPPEAVVGAWRVMRDLEMNPETSLPPIAKDSIGLAVAAQIPCEYCTYFHSAGLKFDGASPEEIREVALLGGLVRHWSTVLNGIQMDENTFRSEVDRIFQEMKAKAPKPLAQAGKPHSHRPAGE